MFGDLANPWTVHRKEERFACSFFSVRSDTVTHGTRPPRIYNSVRMASPGVSIAPIDEDGCTTLIGQYRYVLDRFTWELPGGSCKLDQMPVDAASMELSEETGYSADHWLQLFDGSLSPGTIDGRTHCFVAWGLHSGIAHPEPEEQLLQRRMPFGHFDGAVRRNLELFECYPVVGHPGQTGSWRIACRPGDAVAAASAMIDGARDRPALFTSALRLVPDLDDPNGRRPFSLVARLQPERAASP